MPFTNNRAERALRMAKVHIKIAGCFRTRDGAERFALLRGLVETARQRQWPQLDFLRRGPAAAVRPQPPSPAPAKVPAPGRTKPGVPEQLHCVTFHTVKRTQLFRYSGKDAASP